MNIYDLLILFKFKIFSNDRNEITQFYKFAHMASQKPSLKFNSIWSVQIALTQMCVSLFVQCLAFEAVVKFISYFLSLPFADPFIARDEGPMSPVLSH